MKMDDIKQLLAAQQSELDAVILYKALAEKMKKESDKELMLSLAADEGRHAAILREITQQTLQPKSGLKNLTMPLYALCGKKIAFSIISKVEYAGGDTYKKFFEKYPQTKQIAADEVKHGDMLKNALKK